MEKWVRYNIKINYLFIIFVIIFLGLLLVEATKQKLPTQYFNIQIEAAEIMLKSMISIRDGREALGIPTDERTDPNKTGVIGEEYTNLTTTLGNLSAKRTATSPDFAALMVKYFKLAGLKEGDTVAIGASGSFPGLIIATLSACKAMEIKPLMVYSIGASEYGANIADFTFIDMLVILNHKNIIPYQLLAVSMGGNNDQGEAMLHPESQEVIRKIAYRSGVTFIDTDNLADNIQRRIELYREAAGNNPIEIFVNIGGASPNYGNTSASITYPNGLIVNGPEIPAHPEQGLIFEYQALGVPVIHLLNIRDLALRNGIPIDPIPFPEIGQSRVYFEWQYQKWIIILTILIGMVFLILARKNKQKGEGD